MSAPDDPYGPPSYPGGYDPRTAANPIVPPPPAHPSSAGKTAAIAVAATLVAVAIVVGAFFLGKSDDSAAPTTSAPTTSATTTVAPATSAAPVATTLPAAPAPAAPAVGDVRTAPDGLLCKDLKAQGYSYSAAVDYWRVHGQPNRMDVDKNGIPCETIYSRADVVAYWPSSTYDLSVSYGLPSGLLCRDLEARGVGVYDALRYYIWEGFPSRMDADGNGIPCETVYYNASEVWEYEF